MLVPTECHQDQADGHGWRPTRFQSEQLSLKPTSFYHKRLRQHNCYTDLMERLQRMSPGFDIWLHHLMDQNAMLRG